MDRRGALKALSLLAGSAGLTVTPVTTEEARGVELVLFKPTRPISHEQAARLREVWIGVCAGTALAQTRVAIIEHGIEVEFVRTQA